MVLACGCISEELGLVYVLMKEKTKLLKGFRSEHMVEMLQDIRERVGPRRKIAVFWDNASIHKSHSVYVHAEQLGIKLIYNIPYSP